MKYPPGVRSTRVRVGQSVDSLSAKKFVPQNFSEFLIFPGVDENVDA